MVDMTVEIDADGRMLLGVDGEWFMFLMRM